MRTDPPFTIPDAPLENQRTEPIEEKQRIRRELPEKKLEQRAEAEPATDSEAEQEKSLPKDPFEKLGTKFDDRA